MASKHREQLRRLIYPFTLRRLKSRVLEELPEKEEKISAIIEKKRKLMADMVREDDPGLMKSFSREDLLQFIS